MKRFLVFAGAGYYPSGGWRDFESSFDTVEDAMDREKSMRRMYGTYSWSQVIDTQDSEHPEGIDLLDSEP